MRTSKLLGVVAAPVIALMIGASAGSATTGSGIGSVSQNGSNNNGTQQQSWSDAHTNQKNLFAPISQSFHKFDWMGKDGKFGDFGKSFDNNSNASQDNSANTSSNASNDNLTPQRLDQQQAVITSDFGKTDGSKDWAPSNDWSGKWDGVKNCFCDHGSSIGNVTQNGSNNNWTDQSSWSKASTDQANINLGIGGGANSATQSNNATTNSDATNSNATGQWLGQQQAVLTQGFGSACGCFDSKSPSIGDVSQNGSNDNWTSQDATSKASTNQANIYAPITLWSNGGSGAVTQSNNAKTTSNASNDNLTDQMLKQDQAVIGQGFGASPSIGSVSQDGRNTNGTDQSSASQAKTNQANIYAPITLWGGSSGSVSQSNNANTNSSANNSNATAQDSSQRQAAVTSGFGG
jgi:hypothetical protein